MQGAAVAYVTTQSLVQSKLDGYVKMTLSQEVQCSKHLNPVVLHSTSWRYKNNAIL